MEISEKIILWFIDQLYSTQFQRDNIRPPFFDIFRTVLFMKQLYHLVHYLVCLGKIGLKTLKSEIYLEYCLNWNCKIIHRLLSPQILNNISEIPAAQGLRSGSGEYMEVKVWGLKKNLVAKVIEIDACLVIFYSHILTARPDSEAIDHLWKEVVS